MRKKKATKHDSGKPDLSLVSPLLKAGIAKTMGFGVNKYGRWNYMQGITTSRLLGALMRHIDAYTMGENLDPESGLPHLYHAAANIQMLVDNEHNGTLEDDRYDYTKK